MVIQKVSLPGIEPSINRVEIRRLGTFKSCIARLDASERAIAEEMLEAIEADPPPNHDTQIAVDGVGTALVRFFEGLFIIYQYHMVGDEKGQSSHMQINALFCWKSVQENGVPAMQIPVWA